MVQRGDNNKDVHRREYMAGVGGNKYRMQMRERERKAERSNYADEFKEIILENAGLPR